MNHEPENSESSGGPKPGGAGAGEDIRTIHELVRDMCAQHVNGAETEDAGHESSARVLLQTLHSMSV